MPIPTHVNGQMIAPTTNTTTNTKIMMPSTVE